MLMCNIGANAQWDIVEIAKNEIQYILKTYAQRNTNEEFCLPVEYSAKEPNEYGYTVKLWDNFKYPILWKDTLQTLNGTEIIIKVALGFDWNTEKFVTITGTEEQILFWTQHPFEIKEVSDSYYLAYYYHTDDPNIDFQNSITWNFVKKDDEALIPHFSIMSQ